MNCDWHNDVHLECFTRAEFVPPAMFGEAAWDCLLALHTNERNDLSLDQLTRLISVPPPVLQRCLVELERRQLVTGVMLEENREVRAMLTRGGHRLLQSYISATSALQPRH